MNCRERTHSKTGITGIHSRISNQDPPNFSTKKRPCISLILATPKDLITLTPVAINHSSRWRKAVCPSGWACWEGVKNELGIGFGTHVFMLFKVACEGGFGEEKGCRGTRCHSRKQYTCNRIEQVRNPRSTSSGVVRAQPSNREASWERC